MSIRCMVVDITTNTSKLTSFQEFDATPRIGENIQIKSHDETKVLKISDVCHLSHSCAGLLEDSTCRTILVAKPSFFSI